MRLRGGAGLRTRSYGRRHFPRSRRPGHALVEELYGANSVTRANHGDFRLESMISIIIPTFDEERNVPPLLHALRREETAHEIIVVDGGSRDSTVELARQHGARVIMSEPGRGIQLSRGAAEASGDILLFLHADSVFPRGGLERIEEALSSSPQIIGGNFRLLFDGDTPFSRWLIGFYAFIRHIGLYYGDSGIFVKRSTYDALGGIRPIALMEDLDFVRRLERCGRTCCIAEPPLITSSRRFQGRRSLAIVYGWLKLHTLYYLGISPVRLAQIYAAHTPTSADRPKGQQHDR